MKDPFQEWIAPFLEEEEDPMTDHGTEALTKLEAECAEGRTAPRVSLAELQQNIALVAYLDGEDAVVNSSELVINGEEVTRIPDELAKHLQVLTICVVVLQNGYTIIGKSAPASADNFDALLGRKLAYDDAVRQIWPLMGYHLKQRLMLNRDDQEGTLELTDEVAEQTEGFVTSKPRVTT